jgi:hypothetical protein
MALVAKQASTLLYVDRVPYHRLVVIIESSDVDADDRQIVVRYPDGFLDWLTSLSLLYTARDYIDVPCPQQFHCVDASDTDAILRRHLTRWTFDELWAHYRAINLVKSPEAVLYKKVNDSMLHIFDAVGALFF